MNPFLSALRPLYAGAVALRNAAFDAGLFKTQAVAVPIISIGNISAGGSGKTPLVHYTASLLIQEGHRTAIVSRGYGRSSKGTVLVSEGKGPLVSAEEGGDEPVMLATQTPGAIIISDENRVRGALLACERFGVSAIVLDDAFQHRRIARTLNVLVYDASIMPDEHRLLPAGRLREPLRNMARADFLLLSRCETQDHADTVAAALARYTSAPHAALRFVPTGLCEAASNALQPFEALRERTAYAFCGIGSPSSFERTLSEAGLRIAGFRAFADHYRYSANDVDDVQAEARRLGADYMITTEKDAVRLDTTRRAEKQHQTSGERRVTDLPIYYVAIGIEWLRGEEAFRDAVLRALQ